MNVLNPYLPDRHYKMHFLANKFNAHLNLKLNIKSSHSYLFLKCIFTLRPRWNLLLSFPSRLVSRAYQIVREACSFTGSLFSGKASHLFSILLDAFLTRPIDAENENTIISMMAVMAYKCATQRESYNEFMENSKQ